MTRRLTVTTEKWPLKKPFIIARSNRIETETIKVCIAEGELQGFGECVPNTRYGETIPSTIDLVKSARAKIESGADRVELGSALPAGAARNALDCALWDLEAKQSLQDVGKLSGLGWPERLQTVQTISILPPDDVYREARELTDFPIIKVKVDRDHVLERIKAAAAGAPESKFLIDANESWSFDLLSEVAPHLHSLNAVMIEQPLPAGNDSALFDYSGPLPLFADESCHVASDLPKLAGKYRGVNVKLDKSGGLTEAIALSEAARDHGLDIMVGCMLSTSLGIAPTMFIAMNARYVDIDAPALLAEDRDYSLEISAGNVSALDPRLWGGA